MRSMKTKREDLHHHCQINKYFTQVQCIQGLNLSHRSGAEHILQYLSRLWLFLFVLVQKVILPGSFNDLKEEYPNNKPKQQSLLMPKVQKHSACIATSAP